MPYSPPDTPPEPPAQMGASQFSIIAPYAPGSPDPIYTGADADAGGRDTVAGSVAEAVSHAEARFGELQSDTFGQGSTIGDLMDLPPVPSAAYYDPPRAY